MKQELVIPEECLRDHMADLGKTGSGKTSSLKTIVEWLALQDPPARVCVLDPIKSDWWGVTSSADGKRPGLPFQILGGPHGHVPLRSDQGALVGELVATGKLPLSIVDMADFEPGGLSRFFNEFAPALLRHMRGVVYLVLEEAHEFAPKERAGIGNENLSVHWAKKLATAGRSKGIRLLVATQRTQALHNALLGSCETLLAHRLTAPADQKPVQDWLKANTEKDAAREIGGGLAQLRTGTAWVVSSGMKFAEKVTFPRIVTFDNSATPDSDTAVSQVRTAPVDRGALAELLRVSAEQIDQTDPDKLHQRIKTLEGEIASLTALGGDLKSVVEQDTTAIEAEAYARGVADTGNILEPVFDKIGDIRSAIRTIAEATDRLDFRAQQAQSWVGKESTPAQEPFEAGKKPAEIITENIPPAPRPTITPSVKAAPSGPVEQRVLDALAEMESMRVAQPTREIVGFLAGYSNIDSKGFKQAIATLKDQAAIVFPDGGLLGLTATGRSRATPPPRRSPAQIQARIVEMLGGATGRVLGFLLKVHPAEVSRQRLGAETGYSNVDSKGFKEALAKLKSMDFIDFPSPGHVKAGAVLFLRSA